MDGIYGVNVASEGKLLNDEEDLSLGVLLLNSEIEHVSLDEIRLTIDKQIDALPPEYEFITRKGWEIKRNQECKINLSNIASPGSAIRIKTVFQKPRIGIWHRRNSTGAREDGESLGFVFVDYKASLDELRDVIKSQLGDLQYLTIEDHPFQFLDRNIWPISSSQEELFRVIDIVNHGSVHIFVSGGELQRRQSFRELDYVDSASSSLTSVKRHPSACASAISGPPILCRQPTFVYNNEEPCCTSVGWAAKSKAEDSSMKAKQVLLSYVRNEASQHAVCVKRQLTKLGFSVFLDVDEIKSGIDWQDSLNFAVANCQAFVPLVTPRYGETQWTNREVKLADVLGKFILPISFLNEWPPRVLAIQFATTQFIPWKPQKILEKQTDKGELDIKSWEAMYLTGVVGQISERLKEHFHDLETKRVHANHGSARRSVDLKKMHTLRSCPAQLPEGFQELSQNRAGRPLVVISVHPEQKAFAIELKEMLGGSYEMWCSVDIETDGDDSQGSDTQLFSQEFSQHSQSKAGIIVCSQESEMSSSSDCETISRSLRFQENADEAGVILVVLSKAFAMSKTCKQQVFYCEHRKKIIPIKYEDFCMPGWMSMLIGTGILEDVDAVNYKDLLSVRIEKYLKSQTQEDIDRQMETMISQTVQDLKLQMLNDVVYVYISGGTQFYHDDSEEICKSIGKHLASTEVHLVTGGFKGVGETVGTSYHAASAKLKNYGTMWHILPKSDPKERLKCAPQKEDGTFEKLHYGETLFCGESVRERESIVSRIFDICILVEGGPGAAHEAEQFAWNDHIVIPVKCTGGAAGGKFNVPDRIFELPCGVDKSDWDVLLQEGNCETSADTIGQSVSNIVCSITSRLQENKTGISRMKVPVSDASEYKPGYLSLSATGSYSDEYGSGDFMKPPSFLRKKSTSFTKSKVPVTDTGNQNDDTNSENSSENQNSKKNYKENKLASDSNSIKTSYQKDSLKQPITGQDLLPSINSSCLSVNGDNEVSGVGEVSVVDGVDEDKETLGKFTELRNKKESDGGIIVRGMEQTSKSKRLGVQLSSVIKTGQVLEQKRHLGLSKHIDKPKSAIESSPTVDQLSGNTASNTIATKPNSPRKPAAKRRADNQQSAPPLNQQQPQRSRNIGRSSVKLTTHHNQGSPRKKTRQNVFNSSSDEAECSLLSVSQQQEDCCPRDKTVAGYSTRNGVDYRKSGGGSDVRSGKGVRREVQL